MVECGLMLIGVVFSIVSLKRLKYNKQIPRTNFKYYTIAIVCTKTRRILTGAYLFIMIGCPMAHLVIFTYTSMYISLAVYSLALVGMQILRRKNFAFLDTEARVIYMPDFVIQLDDVVIKDVWIQPMLSKKGMEYCVEFDNHKLRFPINNIEEYEILRNVFLNDAAVEERTDRMRKIKKAVLTCLATGSVLILISLSFVFENTTEYGNNQDVDFPKVYYQEVVLESLPEQVTRLKSGDICALYSYMGAVNVYDRDGKYKYTYMVPMGENPGQLILATDGTYLAVISSDDVAYIYRNAVFIEAINDTVAENKYKFQYVDGDIWLEEDDEREIYELIHPDGKSHEETGNILMIIGIILLCTGAAYVVRTDPKYVIDNLEYLKSLEKTHSNENAN